MSFIPRDEYQPRRGVAMKVLELPSPRLKRVPHRDEFVDRVASQFEHEDFILNHAMDNSNNKITKVKTFKRGEIFAATGNGNVIAPVPQPAPVKRHRGPLSDSELATVYQSPLKDRERRNEQILMEDAQGVFDHMSQPPAHRRHRLPGCFHDRPVDPRYPAKEVLGFEGLGKHMVDKPQGKARGLHAEPFDPLGFRRLMAPARITGLKASGVANVSQLAEVIKHDDNVPLLYRKSPPKAHKFTHRVNFPSPDYDIPGFQGLGASDEPARQTKTKGPMTPVLDHDYRFLHQQQSSSGGPSPSYAAAGAGGGGGVSVASGYPYGQSRTPVV